jgi:Tfp pilus assembly protein PilN
LLTLAREGERDLKLIEASEADLRRGNGESLRRAVGATRPDRVVCVLPASSIIVRHADLTRTDDDDLGDLLDLQAEAHLPDNLPWYRRGAGVMRTHNGGERAILVGWPGNDLPSTLRGLGNGKVRFCPDSGALLALRRAEAPTTSLLYADKTLGALAILCGDSLRSLRIRKTSAADDVERALRELAALGTTPADLEACLVAGEAMRQRERHLEIPAATKALWNDVLGAEESHDASWWQDYGIALGAAAQALQASSANTLADLRLEVVQQKRSRSAGIVGNIGLGRRPYATLFVCLLVLALLPAVRSGARLFLLRQRVGNVEELREKQEELTAQFSLYSAVADRTWPMSKLLADLAAATPPGVEIDSLTLANGQQVQMSGLADSLDLLVSLQENLRDGRVFEDVQLPRRHIGETGKVEFALRAEVIRPWLQAEPAYDYVAESLQQRLYGESSGTNGTTAAVRNDEAGNDDSTTGSRLTDPRAAQQEEVEAPAPLTLDEIQKMTTEDLRKAYTQRLVLKSRPFDAETKTRLEEEANQMRTELRQR